jgi:hypothetical protein
MLKKIAIIAYFLLNALSLHSQGTAGNNASYETRNIIDMPTAGILRPKSYNINCTAFHAGGITLDFSAGIFDWLNMGVAYSAVGIIGEDDIKFQNVPGFNIKIRPFKETLQIPAIVIGFSSQGKGMWINAEDRFETISPGFYLALSKNYKWDLGNLAFHGGLNYSIEPIPEKRSLNFYTGIEQSITSNFAVNFEYNFALDEKDYNYLDNLGILNSAFRFSISSGVTIELQIRDLLQSNRNSKYERRFGIDIVKTF